MITIFQPPQISPLALSFFALFSRTEFALKRCKQFRTRRRGYLEPNWSEFAKMGKIARLYDRLALEPEAAELINLPPQYPILVDDSICWSAQPPRCGDMTELVNAIKDLRNNLFHGEKGRADDGRDERLFKSGIFVLNKMLEASPEVAASFYL